MNIETLISENGKIHQLAMDIDRVINTLEYAESDPDVAYKPAALIKICINQLKQNLSTLNNDIGHDWPENK
ncbi:MULTISPECIES: hypothetical protein [Enterobacter cloacae complex]|uniref:Uncharacterized protein n=1 Tax=Enterobacter kobei TaxID=208224 RepID=A0AAW3XEF8_9ENTR|nr:MULTISPECIES: hypothetical protein [Enterobacter cloacae complex]BBT89897.1 hypothetical protein WP8W19C02_15170 [Enterobacter cloacae]KTI17506.1 hypothetical protein ASV10_04580 [Enterobacter hormaechei subsp. xiangfangensis]MBC6322375.1 hypothetical protein [Enterobacter kobei]MCC7577959.1 hypothetical protein [Enterobacter roggenkampii]MCC7586895.1 hypothetical protein [Enterobacter roggenkampii]